MRRIKSFSGMTLIELVVCTIIIGILAGTALPIAKHSVLRQKEALLQEHLRNIRHAIDKFYERQTQLDPEKSPNDRYPKSLEDLVAAKILRKIPLDPITGKADWITISTSDPEDILMSDQANVFDLRSAATSQAIDGSSYSVW